MPEQISILPPAQMSVAQHDAIIKSIDVDKLVRDNAEKIQDAKMTSMANERAEREPIPTVVDDLFNPEPLVVKTSQGDITIRPMVAYDLNFFKRTNSPFYQAIMGDISGSASLFPDDEQSYELVYQFTHTPKEVYALHKQGVEKYRDVINETIGFVYTPKDVQLLLESVMRHIFGVDMKKIQFDAGAEETDKKKLMSPTSTPLISPNSTTDPVVLAS